MPGEIKMVGTGLKVEVPEGFEIQVRPRSGLAIDKSITVMNSPGTIDSDFRGEIMIILANFGNENFYINKGDRIAQGALCPVYKAMFVEAELSTTERGEGGFGSTGVTSY